MKKQGNESLESVQRRIIEIQNFLDDKDRRAVFQGRGITKDIIDKKIEEENGPYLSELKKLKLREAFLSSNKQFLVSFWVGVASIIFGLSSIGFSIYGNYYNSKVFKQQVEDSKNTTEIARKVQSNQLMLSISQQLRGGSSSFFDDLYNNRPLLKDNGGRFRIIDIDNILLQFELLNNAYCNGLVSADMMNDAFSYDVEAVYENDEIKKYILSSRKQADDQTLYGGFTNLACKLEHFDHPSSSCWSLYNDEECRPL